RKQLYIFDPKTNTIYGLSNRSICDFYVDSVIYNNKLYTICFSRNRTFVFDLNSRKLINEINTSYPFYITLFGNRIYVTSVISKKLYVIDPTSNSVIKELVFDEGPRVIG
ncbi:MAG: YncE family protein, partial [Candidatus Micrarchaeia archaeon]